MNPLTTGLQVTREGIELLVPVLLDGIEFTVTPMGGDDNGVEWFLLTVKNDVPIWSIVINTLPEAKEWVHA
jgi:hypothetical protein